MASKDRTGLFAGDPKPITAETGKRLAEWLDGGASITQPGVRQQEPPNATVEAHIAKPARIGWRDRVAQATSVEELGGIGDDADAALSAGKLTAAQRETLDALIAERHDEIEAMAGA